MVSILATLVAEAVSADSKIKGKVEKAKVVKYLPTSGLLSKRGRGRVPLLILYLM